MLIRLLTQPDIPKVLEIENASFSPSWKWKEEDFFKYLRQRCTGMVVEHDNCIAGFVIYEPKKNELMIINIAVAPKYHGKGIGRTIIRNLLEKIHQQKRNRLIVLMPDGCLASRGFFMKCGGEATRIQTTDTKGLVGFEIAIKPMKSKHVVRVQTIEDECFEERSRNIGSMLGRGTKGAIAVNKRGIEGNEIIGYVLWYEDTHSPTAPLIVNGAIGQITRPDFLDRGVGHALINHVFALGKEITITHIDLRNERRCAFWRSMGVPVPEPVCQITVGSKPTKAA